MQESTGSNYNPDSGVPFWVTVGVWLVVVWGGFIAWLGVWGAVLGWIVAVPAAVGLTICFWIGVDLVRHLARKVFG